MFDIARFMQEVSVMAIPLLLALSFHEAAHGYVAHMLGDPTAKNAGRLTLNPFRHLDLIGTIVFFVARFGWAKPVPVDARYFRNPRKGMMLVALAGPGANFLLAALFALVVHGLLLLDMPAPGGIAEKIIVPAYLIAQAGVFVNLILGVFNLLPLPPLDGSNILAYFLPPRLAYKYLSLGRYGFIILIGIILLGDLLNFSLVGQAILPVVYALIRFLGVPL